ncbi:uncharacterized protein LOC132730050 [Ruditapes philippinarum]|uniref:uncharacterized protein LOC132730050 n=1 Tax=Ruditapes philippinarum TaxID=129788 RepID=UPI00295B5F1D|nr:uncharacterized protein LOC132730050 [Ruditapes philippinarum]
MAMSSSLNECGSDEVRGNDNDDDTDKCFHCVADGEPRPALYFCFNCGVYGRYMCGTCFKLHYRFVKNHEIVGIGNKSASNRLDYENMKKMKVEKDLVSKQAEIMQLKIQVNQYSKENQCHQARIKELEITCKTIEKEKIQGEEMARRNLEHLQNILKEEKAADKYKTILAKTDALQDRTQFDKLKAENEEQNKELQQLKYQLKERNDKMKQLEKKIKTIEFDMAGNYPARPERNRLKLERCQLKTQFDKLKAETEEKNKELQQLKDQLRKGNDKIQQLAEYGLH